MARNDTDRRLRAAQAKSVIVSAATVGTIGGWVAFGTQQTATTAAADQAASADTGQAVAAAPEAAPRATSAPGATLGSASGATAAASATALPTSIPSTRPARRGPVTSTRSSR